MRASPTTELAGPSRVSVVVPAYNAATYLGEALASAVAQTRRPHEILVVDDASTDDTVAVAEAWARRHPTLIRVLRQPANLGQGAARNRGAREADGALYAVLDADDTWEPWHLEEVAGLLDRFPAAIAAGAATRFVGTRSGIWAPRFAPGAPRRVLWESLRTPLMHHSTMIVRRDALLAAGGYSEERVPVGDLDLMMRLAYVHPFVCSHRVTSRYRWHAAQLSAAPIAQVRALYRRRRAMLDRLRDTETPEFVARFEHELRARWWQETAYAARRRSPELARALAELWPLIPRMRRRHAAYLLLRGGAGRRADGARRAAALLPRRVRGLVAGVWRRRPMADAHG